MAVSSLVPAAAGITVSDGNTAGWGKTGENWVLLGRSTTNASSHNFTSLGGYKKLKITVARAQMNVNTQYRMQINGDSSTNYSQADSRRVAAYASPVYIGYDIGNTFHKLLRIGNNGGDIVYITTLIDNCDSTVGTKHITMESVHSDSDFGGQLAWTQSQGHWTNLSAITSLNLYLTTGTFNLTSQSGFIEVWGCN